MRQAASCKERNGPQDLVLEGNKGELEIPCARIASFMGRPGEAAGICTLGIRKCEEA